MYNQDYHEGTSPSNSKFMAGMGRQKQFIIDDEKRNVKIKFNPPTNMLTTKQVDYKPFLIRSQQ